MMTPAQRYVIIGTGVAGIAAALEVRQSDPNAVITLVGAEREGYYSRPGLAYYLTGELNEEQLYPFGKDDWKRLGARWVHAQALQINPQNRQVGLDNGGRLAYDRLLIATGAQAVPSNLPGAGLDGVVKLDHLADARAMIQRARKARRAVVIGGGITALEIVEGFRERGLKTDYLMRSERYWGNVLDKNESAIIEQRLKDRGIQIHYRTELAEILGKRNRVVGVRTRDGQQIKCDLVAVAIGVRPRKELAQAAGLRTDRGILVNEFMQTSDARIFAAGDVAEVYDPASSRPVLDSLWGPAREQGHLAGINMVGGKVPYRKPPAFNVTRLADLPTTIIGAVGNDADQDLLGIARGDSEVWRQPPEAIAVQADFVHNHLRIMLTERSIIGAILIGNQTLSRPLQDLITHHVDITGIHERLLMPGAPISDLIFDFWTTNRNNIATAH